MTYKKLEKNNYLYNIKISFHIMEDLYIDYHPFQIGIYTIGYSLFSISLVKEAIQQMTDEELLECICLHPLAPCANCIGYFTSYNNRNICPNCITDFHDDQEIKKLYRNKGINETGTNFDEIKEEKIKMFMLYPEKKAEILAIYRSNSTATVEMVNRAIELQEENGIIVVTLYN